MVLKCGEKFGKLKQFAVTIPVACLASHTLVNTEQTSCSSKKTSKRKMLTETADRFRFAGRICTRHPVPDFEKIVENCDQLGLHAARLSREINIDRHSVTEVK